MLTKIKAAALAAVPTAAAATLTAVLSGATDWKVILGAALGPFVPVVGAYVKAEPIESALGYLRGKGIDVKVPAE